MTFVDVMQALGLQQHVTEYTHKAFNILDHAYTETGGNIILSKCENKDFISDHCLVFCELKVPKENIVRKTITYRKFSKIDRSSFKNDIQFNDSDFHNVDDLVVHYDNVVRSVVDKHAPEKPHTLTIRHHNPWFTAAVREQKLLVRKSE